MVIVRKLSYLLDICDCTTKSLKDSFDVSTRLHANDAQLVLFVDPDKESLVVVMEDPSSIGPVAVQTTGFQKSVTFPMIFE
jgi:hypothetical protein